MASHHFQVIENSHATSVSQVYDAVDPYGARHLLEVLNTQQAGAWLAAYQQDRAALAQLRHPCLVEVLEIGAMSDGTPVIISERPEGVTLARWLDEGRLAPTDAAMDLLTGLGHALGAAHYVGVSHGALTADDIVLLPIAEHPLGFPRLRGFGYRWLRALAHDPSALAPGSTERAVPALRREIAGDVAALAAIADRLLTPLQRGPRLAAALRAAQRPGAEVGFATVAAFLEALELALDPDAPEAPTAPVPPSSTLHRRAVRRVVGSAAIAIVAAVGLHAVMSPRGPSAGTRPAPSIVAAQPAPAPPPAIETALRPSPAAVEVTVAEAPAPRRAPPRTPRHWRVWSDRDQKVVLVDDEGRRSPSDAPPDAPAAR